MYSSVCRVVSCRRRRRTSTSLSRGFPPVCWLLRGFIHEPPPCDANLTPTRGAVQVKWSANVRAKVYARGERKSPTAGRKPAVGLASPPGRLRYFSGGRSDCSVLWTRSRPQRPALNWLTRGPSRQRESPEARSRPPAPPIRLNVNPRPGSSPSCELRGIDVGSVCWLGHS